MIYIVKLLVTLLVILMCRFFIIDLIWYIKHKKYFYVLLGIILIANLIYREYKILSL